MSKLSVENDLDEGTYQSISLDSNISTLKEYRQAVHDGLIVPPVIENEELKKKYIDTLTSYISREKLEFLTYKYNEFLQRYNYTPVLNAPNFLSLFRKCPMTDKGWDNVNPLFFVLDNCPFLIWSGDDEKYDCLEPFQIHILLLIRKNILLKESVIKIAVSGGQGLGKTKLQSILILFYMVLYGHSGIYTCLSVTLDQSIRSLLNNGIIKILDNKLCKISSLFHLPANKDRLFLKTEPNERVPTQSAGQLAILSGAPSSLATVKGLHAEGITLFMIDEADEIDEEVVGVVTSGLASHGDSLLLLMSNGCCIDKFFGRLMTSPDYAHWNRFTFSVDTTIRTRMNKLELYNACRAKSLDHIETHYHGRITEFLLDRVFFKAPDVQRCLLNGKTLSWTFSPRGKKYAGLDVASGVLTKGNANKIKATVLVLREGEYAEIFYYNREDNNELLNHELESLIGAGFTIIYDAQGVGLRTINNLPVYKRNTMKFIPFNNMKINARLHHNINSQLYDCVRLWMLNETTTVKVTPNKYAPSDENRILDQFMKECLNITYELNEGRLMISPKRNHNDFRDIVDALALTFKLETMLYL